MHSFEVHSNESVCRKKVRLGLEQVIGHMSPVYDFLTPHTHGPPLFLSAPTTLPMNGIVVSWAVSPPPPAVPSLPVGFLTSVSVLPPPPPGVGPRK